MEEDVLGQIPVAAVVGGVASTVKNVSLYELREKVKHKPYHLLLHLKNDVIIITAVCL